jgi:CRP-like cAMP-binding protein
MRRSCSTRRSSGRGRAEGTRIESGGAEVRKGGAVIRSLGAGDSSGEIGLLATGTRTASIEAKTPMKLVAIFAREFNQIEARMPQIAENLRASMRERVARTSFLMEPAGLEPAASWMQTTRSSS